MKISFREMNGDDIAGCAEIFVSAYSRPPWNEDWNLDDAFTRLSNFLGNRQSLGIVALAEETIAGFLIGDIEKWQANLHFYLKEICIYPDYQRKGYGRLLYNEMARILKERKVTGIYLITKAGSGSSSFYESLGFSANKRLGIMGKDI